MPVERAGREHAGTDDDGTTHHQFSGRYLKYTISGFTADPTAGTMTNVGPIFSYAVIW